MAVAKHETRRGAPDAASGAGMPAPAALGRVAGEDLPLTVAFGLLLLGGLLAMAALRAWPGGASQPSPSRDSASLSLGSGPAAGEAAERPPTVGQTPAVPSGPGAEVIPVPPRLPLHQALHQAVDPPPTVAAPALPAVAREAPAQDCAPVFPVRFRAGVGVPRSAIGASLNRLATWLQAHPKAQLLIDGYSDQLGPVANRFAISQIRAQAVADELVRSGAPRGQLKPRAFGHYTPGSVTRSARESRLVLLHVEGYADCRGAGEEQP